MAYPQLVQTPRLILRRWRDDDAAAIRSIWSDPAVLAALRPDETTQADEISAASHRRHVRHWETHGFGLWLAVLRDDAQDTPIGWIGAWHPDFVPSLDGEIEIAWTLRRECWTRGLATEGARIAVATAFEHRSPDRLISLIAPGNTRSAAVATRLGMTHASDTLTADGLGLRVFALAREAVTP